ncbi:Guanylate cyclase (Partial), partial [Seminavis robusta]|eukprot:Sro3647_g349970.1 Guanylate cyclase (364) ;mRNA; r:2-1174
MEKMEHAPLTEDFGYDGFDDEYSMASSSYDSDVEGGGSDMESGSSRRESSDGEPDKILSSQESQQVYCSKMVVYGVLFIAAAAVSTVAYIFLAREEENTMKVEFSAYSREILKQAQANSKRMFEELWDLSKSITSHALDTNSSWPNCTLPYFDIHAHDLKKKTGNLEFVGFAPFVTPENRAGWEQYSVDNQGWIQQDYNYRNWTHAAAPIPTSIHQYNGSGLTQEDYVFEDPQFDYEIPLWQIAPAQNDTSVINLDLATVPVFAHLLWDIKMKKVEQYSRIMDLHFLLGDNLNQNNPDHPRGTIYQPVMEDFRENADVVGFAMGTLTWDLMFENVLFDSSSPLLVEIEGTCNAIFTYKIGGESM